jgi:hypothetical protein
MSFSLSDALRQYGVESGQIDPEEVILPAGEEEFTVITDETQSDLEEAVADLADDVEKLENQDNAAEKVVEAVESLEAYCGQVEALAAAGVPLNGLAAKFLAQGIAGSLEARGIPAAIFQGDVVSMHESFESNQLEDYTTEAEEKGQGVLARLVAMLRAAASAVATAIKEFFTTMGKSASAIKASGVKLKRVASGLKGEAKVKEISSGGFGMVVVGGKVDPKKALDDAHGIYTSGVLKVTKGIRDSLRPLITELSKGTVTGASLKAAGAAVNTSALAEQTIALPGGYSAVFKPGQGENFDRLSGATFGIKNPEKKEAPEKSPILSPAEIGAVGDSLVKVGTLMETARKEGDAVIAANEALISAASKVVGGMGRAIKDKVGLNKSETKEDDAAARQLLKMAKSAISANKGIIPTYVSYLGKLSKEAYRAAAASAGKYGGKAPAADAGAADAGKADDAKKDDAKKDDAKAE